MKPEKFKKIKALGNDAINGMADEMEGALAAIIITTKKKADDTVTFGIVYEGDQELIYNSLISLFKTDDKIGKIAKDAFLEAAGYGIKDD